MFADSFACADPRLASLKVWPYLPHEKRHGFETYAQLRLAGQTLLVAQYP
jgi:hypothetical protein